MVHGIWGELHDLLFCSGNELSHEFFLSQKLSNFLNKLLNKCIYLATLAYLAPATCLKSSCAVVH